MPNDRYNSPYDIEELAAGHNARFTDGQLRHGRWLRITPPPADTEGE